MGQLIEVTSAELQAVEQADVRTSPVALYLSSLDSELSKISMLSNLKQIVRIVLGVDKEAQVNVLSFHWHKIDKFEFQNIINLMKEREYAVETIKTYMSAIRCVLSEANDLGLIDAEHLGRIKRVKRPKGSTLSKGRDLSLDEADTLLNSCPDSTTGIRDKAIISILFGCGLRRKELATLEMKNYVREKGYVVVTGKGNKERKAFLTERAIAYLNRWIDEVRGSDEGAMFVQIFKGGRLAPLTRSEKKGRRNVIVANSLSSQSIYYILKEKQKKLGMEAFTPHDLRKTLATKLLENGENLVTVRDILGHASVNTTQRYVIQKDEQQREAVSKTGL